MELITTDHAAKHRFEARLDGEFVGILTYSLDRDVIDLIHTEIFDAFAGRGLANQFVTAVLDKVRARGLHVIPSCPYIAAFIARHEEYQDLVASSEGSDQKS